MELNYAHRPADSVQASPPSHSRAALRIASDHRWTARRKADVVRAVAIGQLTVDEVQHRYRLSVEEFNSWCHALDREGVAGLQVSHAQHNRCLARREAAIH